MVASPKRLGPENDCAGEWQQDTQKTDPSPRQRGRLTITRPQRSNRNKYLDMSPNDQSVSQTPRLDWLTDRQSKCDFDLILTLRWQGPLVREAAPQKQERNCQTVINIQGLDPKTYWLTDRQSQCDFDFEQFSVLSAIRFKWVLGRRQPREVQFWVQQSAGEFQSDWTRNGHILLENSFRW
jgi:hypothetical protein